MSHEQFSDGIWSKSFDVFRRNLVPCVFYSGTMIILALAAEWLGTDGGRVFGQFAIAAFLAIVAHMTVLRGISGFAAMPKENGGRFLMRFAWRTAILGAIAFTPMIVAIFALLGSGFDKIVAIVASGLVLLVAATLAFAIWGTMLPALVMGAGYSMAEAMARAKSTVGFAFPRLLISFGVIFLLMFAMGFGALQFSGGDGNLLPKTGGIDAILVVGLLVANMVGAFQIVMTSVILSRAYLMAEAAKPA